MQARTRQGRRAFRRRGIVAAGALVVLGATAADALGNARVGLGPPLVVQVIAKAGSDGGHQLVVEPFRDDRVGWRVRQAVFGQPPFSSVDPDCDVNGIVNDVVCDGAQTAVTVTMGDVRDVVRVRQINKDVPGNVSCFELPRSQDGESVPDLITATISLGAGNDDAAYDASGTVCTAGFFAAGHEVFSRFDLSAGSGADVVSGTPFGDALRGDGEGDTLSGLDGRDAVNGGAGLDTVNGNAGNDTLDGGADRDTVNGGADQDLVRGGGGDDVLSGGSGNDRFEGEEGADTIDGGTGEDRISYDAFLVPISVDLGDDLANDGRLVPGVFEERDLLRSIEGVTGGASADTLRGGEAGEDLRGLGSGDTLDGRGGPDFLNGGDGADTLLGGEGDDTISPGLGADTIDGGPGFDRLTYVAPGNTPVTVDLGAPGGAVGGHPGDPEAQILGIENVTGGLGPDTLSGSATVSNVLDGSFGADTLIAGGRDTLIGGRGPDLLRGGGSGFTGSDVLDGAEEDDRIEAKDGGIDTILCGPGQDTAILDLGDILGRFGVAAACEVVEFSPVDDGPPSRATGRVLKLDRAGRTRVRLACPADAKVPCAGILTVRSDDNRSRLLASRRYVIALGGTRTVNLRLRGKLPRRVSVRTRERGASTIGLRRSAVVMRVKAPPARPGGRR